MLMTGPEACTGELIHSAEKVAVSEQHLETSILLITPSLSISRDCHKVT